MYLFLSLIMVMVCDGLQIDTMETILERVGKLEEMAKYQSLQIKTQDRHIESLKNKILKQDKNINSQGRHIKILENTILVQQKQIKKLSNVYDISRLSTDNSSHIKEHPHYQSETWNKTVFQSVDNVDVRERPILQFKDDKRSSPPLIHTGLVRHPSGRTAVGTHAFYAYMSKREESPSKHHTIIFDVIKTNVNSGYNQYAGTFFASVRGTYVFTFSIRRSSSGHSSIELIHNADVVAYFYDYYYGTLSGTVIVSLNPGDVVYLRTHWGETFTGDIESDSAGRSTFCGWLI